MTYCSSHCIINHENNVCIRSETSQAAQIAAGFINWPQAIKAGASNLSKGLSMDDYEILVVNYASAVHRTIKAQDNFDRARQELSDAERAERQAFLDFARQDKIND